MINLQMFTTAPTLTQPSRGPAPSLTPKPSYFHDGKSTANETAEGPGGRTAGNGETQTRSQTLRPLLGSSGSENEKG